MSKIEKLLWEVRLIVNEWAQMQESGFGHDLLDCDDEQWEKNFDEWSALYDDTPSENNKAYSVHWMLEELKMAGFRGKYAQAAAELSVVIRGGKIIYVVPSVADVESFVKGGLSA